MNRLRQLLTVEECKIQASLLLKALGSDDSKKATSAAKRLKRLPEFSIFPIDKIATLDIKRKHALNAIAIVKGFSTWNDLKTQIPFIVGGLLHIKMQNCTLIQGGNFYCLIKTNFLFVMLIT